MRLSPILAATLTAFPTLGLSGVASAQALYYAVQGDARVEDPSSLNGEIFKLNPLGETPQLVSGTNGVPESIPSLGSVNEAMMLPPIVAPKALTPTVTQAPSPDPSFSSSVSQPAGLTPPSSLLTQSPQLGDQTPAPPDTKPPISTPTQETPDRIQFDPKPTSPSFDFQVPNQPTIPAPTNPAQIPPLGGEPRVLVAEVVVDGVDAQLQNVVYDAIRIRPGQTTTQTELQEDVNAVFATGFFARVGVTPENTPLGVRITFVVAPNPVLTKVQVEGNQVLPDSVIEETFRNQYGKILNLRELQEGVKKINEWYQKEGYVLAQIIDTPQVSNTGVVTLEVAEGVVEDIQVRFLNKDGEATDEKGEPIRGRTRDFIVTREFTIKSGDVFRRSQAEADLQRIFGLGIFEDVRLSLNPASDPRKVVVVANVIERSTGSVAAGAGISSASGLFGTISYQEQNFGGNNQKLGAEFQLGVREQLFDISFTDPWIAGDPNRTSYTVNAFNRRSISLIFDGGRQEVRLPNGDVPRVDRLGAGLSFSRPLDRNWVASLGFQYQLVSTRDFDRNIQGRDQFGNPLTFSGTGVDDLYSVQFGAVNDRRNDPLRPTSGSLLRFGVEQTIPIGQGSIFFSRVRGSYSYYIPVNFIGLSDGPQALAFNIQGGTVMGDLPPYEAFALGGVNSVRGYEEGGLGSGRSFAQATVEYRFPIFSIVGGALFLDAATDLGSASSVLGNPAGIRNKPGSGYGYGVGVRIQTPLGPLRLDYGVNDLGNSRIHFGIGERF